MYLVVVMALTICLLLLLFGAGVSEDLRLDTPKQYTPSNHFVFFSEEPQHAGAREQMDQSSHLSLINLDS